MAHAVDVVEENGYRYVGVSREWAKACSVLPCFERLRFPDYATLVLPYTINGVDVVIQNWKGSCPRCLGNAQMPGGIGAEVGIYSRVPPDGASTPDTWDDFSSPSSSSSSSPTASTRSASHAVPKKPLLHGHPSAKSAIGAAKSAVHSGIDATKSAAQNALDKAKARAPHDANSIVSNPKLWWPAPDLHCDLQFELFWKNKSFFKSKLIRDTYWCTQWMDRDDYRRYSKSHDTPIYANHFTQRYWINGKQLPDWVGC